MEKFRYLAVTKEGKEIKGVEEADNMHQVVSVIRERGYYPVKVSPVEKRGKFSLLNQAKVKNKILAVSTRQLATLLGAGLPLIRALNVIADQQQGYWKKVLLGLIEAVERGSSFSDALGRYPRVFSKLYINMVKAGESAGLLDLILDRLADFYEKSQKLKSKILAALIYPCIVLAMAVLILIGLMIFVVPKFAAMFRDMDIELPGITSMLINISSKMATLRFWIIVAITIVLIKLLLAFAWRISKIRYVFDMIKLKFPITGKLTCKIAVSRFGRTLGTLVASGVPILQALNIVKETADNEVVARGLSMVHDSIKEGESIVAPLRQVFIFDPIVINMMAVGEETGQLDKMLIKVADTYGDEVDVIISGLTSLLEPFLIIIMAVIIGFIVISLFLPLVKLMSSMAGV